ncbi:MAG: copper ion binding protein [Verrucomicrobiota bacterium]
MKSIKKFPLALALSALFLTSNAFAKDEKTEVKKDSDKSTVVFAVDGMSCMACSMKVEDALYEMEGVDVTEVSAKTKQAVVSIDTAKVKKSQIAAAIEKTGFVVKGEKLTLPVSGMACVSCSGKVTTALTAMEGVKEAEVSHDEGQAVVVIDGEKTSKETVASAIEKLGYKVGEESAKG